MNYNKLTKKQLVHKILKLESQLDNFHNFADPSGMCHDLLDSKYILRLIRANEFLVELQDRIKQVMSS